MYTMLAAALALASTVCATPISRRDDSVFSFWTNSPNLTEWAVVNAHVNAGVNLIEIQRPTAYTSDNATFNDTRVVFQLQSEGSTYQYGLTLPDVEEGSVGEVTATEGGQTGTPHFGFNSDDLALYNNDYRKSCFASLPNAYEVRRC